MRGTTYTSARGFQGRCGMSKSKDTTKAIDEGSFGVPICDDCMYKENMYSKMASWLRKYLKGEKLDRRMCSVCGKRMGCPGYFACPRDKEGVGWLESLHNDFRSCFSCGDRLSKKDRMRISVSVLDCRDDSEMVSSVFACRKCTKKFWILRQNMVRK